MTRGTRMPASGEGAQRPPGTGHRVSVVACSLRCGAELRACLSALRGQVHPPLEIIVVSPTPATPKRNGGIRWVHDSGNAGLAAARNLGVAAAGGDVIAFIDDDAVADPRWLAELAAGFANPRVGGVGGHTLAGGRGAFWSLYNVVNPLGWVHIRHAPTAEAHGKTVTLVGTNMAFRRDALDSVGGFDPYFTFYLEDTDISLRLVRAGWRLVIAPRAVVQHNLLLGHHRMHIHYQVSRSRSYFVVKNFRDRVPAPILFMTTLLGLAYDAATVLYNQVRGSGRMGGRGFANFLCGIRNCVVGWARGLRAGLKASGRV